MIGKSGTRKPTRCYTVPHKSSVQRRTRPLGLGLRLSVPKIGLENRAESEAKTGADGKKKRPPYRRLEWNREARDVDLPAFHSLRRGNFGNGFVGSCRAYISCRAYVRTPPMSGRHQRLSRRTLSRKEVDVLAEEIAPVALLAGRFSENSEVFEVTH